MDHRYLISLFWSKDDETIIAEVPELAGCAADGKTYEQALENVKQVMTAWIETAQTLGRPVPEPKQHGLF